MRTVRLADSYTNSDGNSYRDSDTHSYCYPDGHADDYAMRGKMCTDAAASS